MQTISKIAGRQDIKNLEDLIRSKEDCLVGDNDRCPLKHSFSDGIYVREIFIPEGATVVGKIHKHDHPNFLMSGTVVVATEFGREKLTGPISMISKAGTKRALYAVTDLVWITVHHNPTNTQNLSEIEKEVIADSYEEFDLFIQNKQERISQ